MPGQCARVPACSCTCRYIDVPAPLYQWFLRRRLRLCARQFELFAIATATARAYCRRRHLHACMDARVPAGADA